MLNLQNAYFLVQIRQGDEFGLRKAPAVFQALVYNVLRDMLNRFLILYIDNILISETLEEHVQHLRLVLQRLLENCL